MGACLCARRSQWQYNCEGSTHRQSEQAVTLSNLQTAIDGVEDKRESLENEIEKYEQQLNETK